MTTDSSIMDEELGEFDEMLIYYFWFMWDLQFGYWQIEIE